ncbi:SIR2 family protein [Neomoorella thermoacetica]|uniref:SIR2 family protein n=1 Tax=Neomoorella thermoacetica TaxID=1525 RepID=UPI003BF4E373
MLTTGALEEVGFITLNYDPFLDQALIEAVGEENINYGIQLEPWGRCERRAINVSREKLRKPIQLVKFHGSMDWMFCPYCHKIYQISTQRALSQDLPLCSNDRTPLSWFLYPPMREKYYMPEVWLHLHRQADELLRKADRVIFIGYSLSDEDAYFRYRVKRSLYRVENPVDIVVVDKTLKEEKRPTSVEKNYWHFFGPVDYRPVGFPAFSLAPF